MAAFDYGQPAELFSSHGRTGFMYRRFATAAEAIRYAIEILPATSLPATAIKIGGERYRAQAILALYEHDGYPMSRKASEQ